MLEPSLHRWRLTVLDVSCRVRLSSFKICCDDYMVVVLTFATSAAYVAVCLCSYSVNTIYTYLLTYYLTHADMLIGYTDNRRLHWHR